MVPNLPLFPICDDINSMATRPAIVENVKKTKRDINKWQMAKCKSRFRSGKFIPPFYRCGPDLERTIYETETEINCEKKKGKKKNNNEMSKKMTMYVNN